MLSNARLEARRRRQQKRRAKKRRHAGRRPASPVGTLSGDLLFVGMWATAAAQFCTAQSVPHEQSSDDGLEEVRVRAADLTPRLREALAAAVLGDHPGPFYARTC